MKFVNNPYLMGVAILVSEFTTNFFISKLFNFDLGDNNLSAIVIFIAAGYLIASVTKRTMSRLYNIKLVSTYFAWLTLILLTSFLGGEINLVIVWVFSVLMAIFALISYFAIVFGQSLYMKNYNKNSEISGSDSN